MGSHNSKVRILALATLTLLLLTACGTFEVGIVGTHDTGSLTRTAATRAETVRLGTRTATSVAPTPTSDRLTATQSPTAVPVDYYAASGRLRVAFVQDGNVWLWTVEDQRLVQLTAGGGASGEVRMSDDGAMVAYQRGDECWVVSSDGGSGRPLVTAEKLMDLTGQTAAILDFDWVPGTHVLAYNTRLRPPGGDKLNDDLHVVNTETMQHSTLLTTGEGGKFHYSPDGSQIAIVTRVAIHLIDADGSNRRERVLTFTPVATHDVYGFYPRPYWAADGSALRVAIPPANPTAQRLQQTTLWHIATDGAPATVVGSITAAALFGPDVIAFSPDLEYVAYAQERAFDSPSPEAVELWLEVMRLEDGATMAYPDSRGVYGWAPDSYRYAFLSGRQAPQLWIGEWSGPIQPGCIDAGSAVSDLRWVDPYQYLVVARRGATMGGEGDQWDLLLCDIEGPSTIVASVAERPQYDFGLRALQPVGVAPLATPTPDASVLASPTVTAAGPRFATPTPTATDTPPIKALGIELVGYLGSSPSDVLAVQGNRAYVGLGMELAILDVSNASRARRLDYLVLRGPVLEIAVSGDHAYVAAGDGAGLYTIDASNPAELVVLENLYTFSKVSGVVVSGHYAYVSGPALRILDISDPGAAVEIATHEYPADPTVEEGKVAAVDGEYAYTIYRDVVKRAGGFRIVDVSDPARPVGVSSFHVEVPVQEMTVDGGYAYLLVGEGIPRLAVVDVSDPTNPVEVELAPGGPLAGNHLAIAGAYAYLSYPGMSHVLGGLQVIDVADPSNPLVVGRIEGFGPEVRDLAVDRGRAFVTTGDGLLAVDVSDPPALEEVGFYLFDRVSGTGRDLVVKGNYAYVAAGADGLQVVALSDPVHPKVVSRHDTAGHSWAVALSGTLACLADEYNGLRLIDVGDPLHPVEVGFYDVPGMSEFFHGVAVADGYAYIADGGILDTGLRVVDLSDATNPREVAYWRLGADLGDGLPPRVEDVAVANGCAYLAAGAAGLRVVDVSDPAAPVEIGHYDTSGRADNLVVVGSTVYLADGDLRIVDVADPRAPAQVGFYDVYNLARTPHVAVQGSFAYVTGTGIQTLDVSEPRLPLEVGVHPIPWGNVAVSEQAAYVIGNGFFILRRK